MTLLSDCMLQCLAAGVDFLFLTVDFKASLGSPLAGLWSLASSAAVSLMQVGRSLEWVNALGRTLPYLDSHRLNRKSSRHSSCHLWFLVYSGCPRRLANNDSVQPTLSDFPDTPSTEQSCRTTQQLRAYSHGKPSVARCLRQQRSYSGG